MKIVCLGNEFIEEDSFAKKVGALLCDDYEVINIKDSFELMGIVSEIGDIDGSGDGGKFILLDVVLGLDGVRNIDVGELRVDSILSAHDFDVGYVLGLLGADVGIIGIPMSGNVEEVAREVEELIAHGLRG